MLYSIKMNSNPIERYLNPFLKLSDAEIFNIDTLKEFIDVQQHKLIVKLRQNPNEDPPSIE